MATSFFQDKISECKHNAELIFQQHPNINGLTFKFEGIAVDVFEEGKADAALAASIFHFKEIGIPELKAYLRQHHINVRI